MEDLNCFSWAWVIVNLTVQGIYKVILLYLVRLCGEDTFLEVGELESFNLGTSAKAQKFVAKTQLGQQVTCDHVQNRGSKKRHDRWAHIIRIKHIEKV